LLKKPPSWFADRDVSKKESGPLNFRIFTIRNLELEYWLPPISLYRGQQRKEVERMDRATKAQEIASLSSKFAKSKAAFLVDFKGMSVEQVTSLRKTLSPLKAEMRVVRNTLAKRALIEHPSLEAALSNDLVGTNAVVFAYEDVGASAKALTNFAKDVEQLDVKSGVMDGSRLDKAKVIYLATLPSKEVLRAQLLGLFQAPAQKLVGTLAAVPSGFLRVLSAHQSQKDG